MVVGSSSNPSPPNDPFALLGILAAFFKSKRGYIYIYICIKGEVC